MKVSTLGMMGLDEHFLACDNLMQHYPLLESPLFQKPWCFLDPRKFVARRHQEEQTADCAGKENQTIVGGHAGPQLKKARLRKGQDCKLAFQAVCTRFKVVAQHHNLLFFLGAEQQCVCSTFVDAPNSTVHTTTSTFYPNASWQPNSTSKW